jgi:hypothetical protein
MEVTYLMIIALVTYILGALVKTKIDKIPNKYIPLQNVIIGLVAGIVCYLIKIEPNLVNSILLCLLATTGAGGVSDLVNKNNYKKEEAI